MHTQAHRSTPHPSHTRLTHALAALGALVLAAVALVAAPERAQAQGFAQSEGSLFAKASLISSAATEVFGGIDEKRFTNGDLELGDRTGFWSIQGTEVGGYLIIEQLQGDIFYTPFKDTTLIASIPLFKGVYYHNDTTPYTAQNYGVGDINLGAGYQWTPKSFGPFGSSIYGHVKVPTTFNTPYTNNSNLGDGQFDFAVRSASTLSLGPVALDGSVTYRHRLDNDQPNDLGITNIDLADELEAFGSIGGSPFSGAWMSLGYSALLARTPWVATGADGQEFDLIQPKSHSLFASFYMELSRKDDTASALDLWFRAPLAGQDMPVLWSGGIGYAYSTNVGN